MEFLNLVGEDEASDPPLTETQFNNLKESRLHWAIEINGICIGVALLHSLNNTDKRAEYSIGIFKSEHWGKGYGVESTRLVLRHAFNDLSIHRIGLRVLIMPEPYVAMKSVASW